MTILLRAERRARGTRTGSRALTGWYQALLVLAWFRNQGDIALVGAGFGVSRATAYRYRDEVIDDREPHRPAAVLSFSGAAPRPTRRPRVLPCGDWTEASLSHDLCQVSGHLGAPAGC